MIETSVWWFLAAASLLLSGLVALRRQIGLSTLGLVVAFGSRSQTGLRRVE